MGFIVTRRQKPNSTVVVWAEVWADRAQISAIEVILDKYEFSEEEVKMQFTTMIFCSSKKTLFYLEIFMYHTLDNLRYLFLKHAYTALDFLARTLSPHSFIIKIFSITSALCKR
jgi:hypothetical protein